MEIRHMHARFHSKTGAFAPVLKFDYNSVFGASATCLMSNRLGVGMRYSGPYAYHMLCKVERPKAKRTWRTIRDNVFAMMHIVPVLSSMCSCAISTVVYLRNRTISRAAGPSRGVPLTLMTSGTQGATTLRVFGCIAFLKVPDKLRRKLGEKAFRGIMVGYPSNHGGLPIGIVLTSMSRAASLPRSTSCSMRTI
jgi:hypothetical protein